MIVGRDQFLKAVSGLKRKTKVVDVPELGEDAQVIVKEMDSVDQCKYEEELTDLVGDMRVRKFDNFRARLVAKTAVDEEGNRLFSDEDAIALGKASASLISRLFDAACEVNAMSPKDIEEIRKNLGKTTVDESSSGS